MFSFGGKGVKRDMTLKIETPGAGHYENQAAIGKQVLSANSTGPQYRVGKSTRDKEAKVSVS